MSDQPQTSGDQVTGRESAAVTSLGAERQAARMDSECISKIDEWSAHLWHTSQHNNMVIALGGRLQALANEMREAAGLETFGWNDAFPDERFGECSVHLDDCEGQHTHGRPRRA